MGNIAEVVPQTPMSSQTQDIHAYSPDAGIYFCDDFTSGASPRGKLSSLARRATPEEAGVSVQVREELVFEVTCPRESTLSHAECMGSV